MTRRPQPWSMTSLRQAAARYQAGERVSVIARDLGRRPSQVWNALPRVLGRPLTGRPVLARVHPHLVELHRAGATDTQLAAGAGCTVAAISKWRSRHGLPRNRPPCPPPSPEAAGRGREAQHARRMALGLCEGWPGLRQAQARVMTDLWLHGPTGARQVATRLGCNRQTATHHLRALVASGWAAARPRGNWTTYRVADGVGPCATARPRLEAQRAGLYHPDAEAS